MDAPDVPTGGQSERFSVSLTPRTVRAMSTAQQFAEEPKSQVVNKGVQLYAYMLEIVAGGGEVYVRLPGETQPRSVLILPAHL